VRAPQVPAEKAPGQEAAVVVLCGDLGAQPATHQFEELQVRLRQELSGTLVLRVPGMCERPKGLVEALSPLHPRRVVLACRVASQRLGELHTALRRAAAPPGGVDIVDLAISPGLTDQGARRIALEQSIALLKAAVARVTAADLEAPVCERTSLSVGGVSRRSLFRGGSSARHPVAVWQPERCPGGVGCTACVKACPHGALSRQAARVVVDGDSCTSCGVCVAACHNGAFTLPGAGLDGLAAAAGILVESIAKRGSATGVALVCQQAKTGPRLGDQFLALRVPSMEMVSAGWLLQLLAAGVGTKVVACEDSLCCERGGELSSFVNALAGVLGAKPEAAQGPGGRARLSQAGREAVRGEQVRIELREPQSTMQALAALGGLETDRTRWQAAGPGCSLGMLRVDASGCSLCEVCVSVCPTGALQAERGPAESLRLSFDPGCCTACGACVAGCPEGAVGLEKAVAGADVGAGRRVVATQRPVTCESCGAPLGAGLSVAALLRMGASHPFIDAAASRICADCRLGGRSVSSRGTP